MSTRYSFTEEIIKDFEMEYDTRVMDLTTGPSIDNKTGSVRITNQQMHQISERLRESGNVNDILENLHPRLPSVSISLFVVNDATWKLMEKKDESNDCMLPMSTIPWFYWDETSQNKWGAKRHAISESDIHVDAGKKKLTISGEGGDFCGIVSRSVLTQRFSPWRIIIPDLPSSSKKVPNYESAKIVLQVDYKDAKCTLYPHPRKDFDYTFSENPKIFYYHGLELTFDGKASILKVGRRRETNLSGQVTLLLGRPTQSIEHKASILSYHIWLNELYSELVGIE